MNKCLEKKLVDIGQMYEQGTITRKELDNELESLMDEMGISAIGGRDHEGPIRRALRKLFT